MTSFCEDLKSLHSLSHLWQINANWGIQKGPLQTSLCAVGLRPCYCCFTLKLFWGGYFILWCVSLSWHRGCWAHFESSQHHVLIIIAGRTVCSISSWNFVPQTICPLWGLRCNNWTLNMYRSGMWLHEIVIGSRSWSTERDFNWLADQWNHPSISEIKMPSEE